VCGHIAKASVCSLTHIIVIQVPKSRFKSDTRRRFWVSHRIGRVFTTFGSKHACCGCSRRGTHIKVESPWQTRKAVANDKERRNKYTRTQQRLKLRENAAVPKVWHHCTASATVSTHLHFHSTWCIPDDATSCFGSDLQQSCAKACSKGACRQCSVCVSNTTSRFLSFTICFALGGVLAASQISACHRTAAAVESEAQATTHQAESHANADVHRAIGQKYNKISHSCASLDEWEAVLSLIV